MTTLFIGVDGGGTSTRCVVATEAGRIAGRGNGAGANILSAADPGGSLRAALGQALEGLVPGQVAGGVFALAGAESARERAESLVTGAWRACGLPGRPEIVPDPLAAFAGATEEPSGTVLIAGTGAVAARVADRRLARRIDGHGWLLGDDGSGVWIGRRAVRAVLAALDGRTGPTSLLCAVAAAVVAQEAAAASDSGEVTAAGRQAAAADSEKAVMTTQRVVRAVHEGLAQAGPAWLGRLAPAVEAAAGGGDAAALEILGEAADRLVATTRSLGPGHGPLVLAGSLLTQPTLLAAKVRGAFGDDVIAARDNAAGAAALALRTAAPDAATAHRTLIA
ncbi:N-acetylglucosamine kinase [Planobispora siamensis]|uniref:N-acetylglucosamine kinase n=1 Tax=Planobispora siamensis TaxID=936338 RepID=A0A8J3SM26_9ACTN|nr:BadF/BadG/BcrA/BcrD ATPase family protein [Planobispora siamensis]GIH94824.1 N-acetylglucosamine kinase [Planobispora siamensis]